MTREGREKRSEESGPVSDACFPDCEDFSYIYGDGQWGMMTKAVAQAIRAEAAAYAISPLFADSGFDK